MQPPGNQGRRPPPPHTHHTHPIHPTRTAAIHCTHCAVAVLLRFLLGKNKVMQVALGTTEKTEYREALALVSAVSAARAPLAALAQCVCASKDCLVCMCMCMCVCGGGAAGCGVGGPLGTVRQVWRQTMVVRCYLVQTLVGNIGLLFTNKPAEEVEK